ncbi:MAG TPA: phosphoserine phosphatase SerB [Devosia sp.]|nr:phosphoserine phosphatase SerB [Devosia sp.]
MSVLCLIANPQTPALTSQIVQAIHREIGGEINWLAQTIACEIIAPKSTSSIEIATQAVNTLPVDVVMVPRTNRRKKLLLADMDSTMIEQECIDELADALGLKPEISAITERAMRGELDFSEALKTRVALLKGLDLDVIKQVRRQAITLSPGGRVLVKTMQEYGAYTSLVSGGFTLFADYFARRIGFDEAIANMLEMDENQKLTGTVSLPIVDSETKVSRLRTLVSQLKITTADAVTVGDGANDLPMLQAAGLGVALHAKPAVAAAAPYCIRHGDLTALLYLQGFNEEEFVR